MKSILNTIFFIILFINITTVFSQEKTSYRLVETYTNAFFFNAIAFEGEILFGSDEGVVSINRQTINIENDSVDDGGLEYAEFDLTSVVRASATVTNTDDMLNRIIATQSSLGANKNAIDSNLQRLSHSSVALYSAKSRISDLNVASATADLVKLDLLNKSAMAMISQTSSSIEKLAKLLLR